MTQPKNILLLLLICTNFVSQASIRDSLFKNEHFELSFGQSLLFISNSKQIDLRKQEALVVPTNAILFFAELRPHKTMRIPIFFNLATETKQFIIDGLTVSERAAPTIGTGLTFKVFEFKIDSTSKIEFEAKVSSLTKIHHFHPAYIFILNISFCSFLSRNNMILCQNVVYNINRVHLGC